jgi:hypothetical protein
MSRTLSIVVSILLGMMLWFDILRSDDFVSQFLNFSLPEALK